MGRKKKLVLVLDEDDFFGLINRARTEGAFVSENGWVNIPKLVSLLITTYADGNYKIVRDEAEGEQTK